MNQNEIYICISSVIRQKGESQDTCFKKTKHSKFSEKQTCAYQEVRNVRFCALLHYYWRFLDIAKFADFLWKNADVSRTQGVCYVIHIFVGSPLGKV